MTTAVPSKQVFHDLMDDLDHMIAKFLDSPQDDSYVKLLRRIKDEDILADQQTLTSPFFHKAISRSRLVHYHSSLKRFKRGRVCHVLDLLAKEISVSLK